MLGIIVLAHMCTRINDFPEGSVAYCDSNDIIRNVIFDTKIEFSSGADVNAIFLTPTIVEGLMLTLREINIKSAD